MTNNHNKHIYDVIVIGGGPGGYTAALYCTRAGLDTLVAEKLSPGGQMCLTDRIDNYPGFEQGIDGFSLGQKMQQCADRFGSQTVQTEVISVSLKENPKIVTTDSETLYAKSVIIATGAEHRHLGIDGEKDLVGKGVSYCAACDGMFYKGKSVVVIGGGNSAAADALLLSKVCTKVTVVHRRDQLRATKIYHEPLLRAANVEFCWNSRVVQLLHKDTINGVVVEDVNSGEQKDLQCDGLFVSIGRIPVTKLFANQVNTDDAGYIIADETTITNIDGVYAAGDVRTKTVRQIVTATADGAVAAHYAEQYIAQQH